MKMKTENKKQLTNDDILRMATVVPSPVRKTLFAFSIWHIRDYNVQKNIRDNEPIIVEEAKKVIESITATVGDNWKRNDPKVLEILDMPASVKLKKVKITDEQMVEFRPNGDAYDILEFIRE